MASTLRLPVGDAMVACYQFTNCEDGDLHIGGDAAELAARRHALRPGPWTWLRQVHGDRVVVVEAPGEHAGTEADGAITARPYATLAVHTADCAPVLLIGVGPDVAAIAAVHAGWRGVDTGVLDRAIEGLVGLGAIDVRGVLGPCIHAGCYEFGAEDLERLAARLGDGVIGRTRDGSPALDMVTAIRATLDRHGVELDTSASVCTGCETDNFSHRVRRDAGRQALVAWLEPAR